MSEETQKAGAFHSVQTEAGVHFEKNPVKEATGQAFVEPEKSKSRRALEMEAGAARVAKAAAERLTRPPVVKSEAELRAEGSSVPVFRPNSVHADRVVGHQGRPVSQQLGALMRRVNKPAPETPPATG